METFKKNKKAEITNFIFSTSEKQKQNKKFKRYYQLTTYGPHTNLAQIEKTAQLSTQISKLKIGPNFQIPPISNFSKFEYTRHILYVHNCFDLYYF